ncbi:uncharacterized protein THITE_2097958 [Thermothielavioides terrestris NRRL 8126]|uniref:Peptidase A1 domain-containing protein n=1 Tax=Thermothielavioides terrestris (strain ATCC 38088 / NRRL 8126) TaxID=578455 RepID=G2RGU4_THETT|nr:uncharacterized protein THITE_2097958 [Thermothielavioides terrestris NRRL 8126]AEO71929.1 hypothetical protein THITE_2097958 [Thermothielavioides terrestris NRRL 8126]
MPSLFQVVAALLPAAVLASGLDAGLDDNRLVQLDGLIRYPIVPQRGGSLFGKHFDVVKRQIGTGTTTQRSGTFYTINLSFGTPGQSVPVQFDTGSFELWVNPVCSQAGGEESVDFCNAQPRFTSSSTFIDLHQNGSAKYGKGSVQFQYIADYVSVGSAKITQQVFGVAYNSSDLQVGIMGAGPWLDGWDSPYPSVVDSLAVQGFTKSRAFSLDLRGLDSTRGSVIFGGLDAKKYSGNLVKLPIIPSTESPDQKTRFWVYLDGISVNQPDGKVVQVFSKPAGGKGQPVVLDSGYTLSALPSSIFQKLLAAFPSAKPQPGSDDQYIVDCADPGQGGSIDFTFGNAVINVRYYDFVWHLDSNLCVLGAFADDNHPTLGDTFLRSAYVVYDWDNRNIHLGQSADCGTNLVPIGKGPDAVPSLRGECGQASSTTTSATSSPTSSHPTSTHGSTSSTPTSPPSGNATTSSPTITKTTITYTTHTTYTVTSCPPTVPHCPAGTHGPTVITEIITATTAICPETTATYTLRSPTPHTVTVTPVPPPQRTPKVVPGCTSGAPTTAGPAPTTLVPSPSATTVGGGNGTVPTQAPVVAGAGRVPVVGGVVAAVAVAVGGVVMGVLGL